MVDLSGWRFGSEAPAVARTKQLNRGASAWLHVPLDRTLPTCLIRFPSPKNRSHFRAFRSLVGSRVYKLNKHGQG